MNKQRPRWESEILGGKPANPKACMTCMFAHGEAPWADEPMKGCCQIYEYPESKPNEVYFDGENCDGYEESA